MNEIVYGVSIFLAIQFILVLLIVSAKKSMLPGGEIKILINDDKEIQTEPGGKLLTSLADQGIFLSSACGGGGSCGQPGNPNELQEQLAIGLCFEMRLIHC